MAEYKKQHYEFSPSEIQFSVELHLECDKDH